MIGNIIHSLVARLLVSGINFLVLIVSSRYLGVSSRGEISLFLLNLMLVQVVNEVFTGYSLVHFIPRFHLGKVLTAGVLYSLICCAAVNFVLAMAGRMVGVSFFSAWSLSLLVVLNTFFCVLLLATENVRVFNALSVFQPLLLLAGLFFSLFVLRIYTFEAYLYPLFFSFAASASVSLPLAMRQVTKPKALQEFRPGAIFLKGFYFQAATLMFIFANRYSFYLLPGKAEVGLYACASVLMESVLIIAAGIAPVLLSRVANSADPPRSAPLALALAKASLVLSAMFALLIALLPEELFTSVLGKGFSGIKPVMLMYAPAVIFISFFGTLSQFFSAVGRQRTVLLCYSAGFLHTLAAGPFFVHRFGVNGAAFTACISFFLMLLGISALFMKAGNIRPGDFLRIRPDFRLLREELFGKSS